MKLSPQQLFREAEALKSMLNDNPMSKESWMTRRKLGQLLETLLLNDLDYALDKKVEQDLWNVVYRSPITALQSKSKESKNSSQNQIGQLSLTLEAASGFYLQLLQKIACMNEIDIIFHPADFTFGLPPDWPKASRSNKSSVLYICQHCMVHLGDIARYRGQSLQAETFYRHAIDLIPSNGQPYNQLAILEAASGEKLSTVFFYTRSLAVQHPFPLAATNLNKLYCQMSSDNGSFDSKARMSPYEYISFFLQFHSLVHLGADFKKAEKILAQLTTSLPALIIAEKLETWQLVQMVTICMFTLGHAWNNFEDSKDDILFDSELLSSDESQTVSFTLDLIAAMLNAFLLPIHAILDLKEIQDYFTIPAVKVILDWLLHHQQVKGILKEEAFLKRPQIWQGLCKLLNSLDAQEKAIVGLKNMPLPEDWDMQCFLPLQNSHKGLQFQNQDTISDEKVRLLRTSRLKLLSNNLASLEINGNHVLSLKECDDGSVEYSATQAVVLADQALIQQLKDQLAVTNNNASHTPTEDVINEIATVLPELKVSALDTFGGPLVQEVRFKLDDHEMKDKRAYQDSIPNDHRHLNFRSPPPPMQLHSSTNDVPLLGNRERKLPRQNVALQAILQQRAQNYNRLKETSINQPLESKDESWMSPSFNNSMPPSMTLSNRTSVPPGHFLGSQVNMHMNGKQVDPNNYPLHRSQMPPPPIQPQQTPMFNTQQRAPMSMGITPSQNQQNNMASAFMSNPRMMWSYNMPSYPPNSSNKMAPPLHPLIPPSQVYPEQQKPMGDVGSAPHFLMPQQESLGVGGHRDNMIQSILGTPTPNNMTSPYHQMAVMHHRSREQSDASNGYQMGNMQSLEEAQRGLFGMGHMSYGNHHLVNSNSGMNSSNEINTYSLFNSPWSSGLTSSRNNKEGSQNMATSNNPNSNNMENILMQHRTQSLWSGPGQTPLERLLEQQRQHRDASNP